jgi:cytochrome c5
MMLRGAQLTPAEVDTVVNYLALNMGPGINLPPAKPAALPAGAGKQLVEAHCGLCHDLERIVAVHRRKADWPVIVTNMVPSAPRRGSSPWLSTRLANAA